MPECEHPAGWIGGNSASAIEVRGSVDQIALGFEACRTGNEARIEQGRALGRFRSRGSRSIPDDMDRAGGAQGELRATDGSDGERTAGLAVYLNLAGRKPVGGIDPGVADVGGGGFAVEPQAMDVLTGVHRQLGLHPARGQTEKFDRRRQQWNKGQSGRQRPRDAGEKPMKTGTAGHGSASCVPGRGDGVQRSGRYHRIPRRKPRGVPCPFARASR